MTRQARYAGVPRLRSAEPGGIRARSRCRRTGRSAEAFMNHSPRPLRPEGDDAGSCVALHWPLPPRPCYAEGGICRLPRRPEGGWLDRASIVVQRVLNLWGPRGPECRNRIHRPVASWQRDRGDEGALRIPPAAVHRPFPDAPRQKLGEGPSGPSLLLWIARRGQMVMERRAWTARPARREPDDGQGKELRLYGNCRGAHS